MIHNLESAKVSIPPLFT